jgi:CBS domain-containing protein
MLLGGKLRNSQTGISYDKTLPNSGVKRRAMFARAIMTHDVVSVKSDTTVREVARLLINKSISAVPVVDNNGRAIGMVSESDIASVSELDRGERSQWWLAQLAEGEPLNEMFLAAINGGDRGINGLMAQPVVSVYENATVDEIARTMENHKIKRVVVTTENGAMSGIVTRADIIRAVASGHEAARRAPALLQNGRAVALD